MSPLVERLPELEAPTSGLAEPRWGRIGHKLAARRPAACRPAGQRCVAGRPAEARCTAGRQARQRTVAQEGQRHTATQWAMVEWATHIADHVLPGDGLVLNSFLDALDGHVLDGLLLNELRDVFHFVLYCLVLSHLTRDGNLHLSPDLLVFCDGALVGHVLNATFSPDGVASLKWRLKIPGGLRRRPAEVVRWW